MRAKVKWTDCRNRRRWCSKLPHHLWLQRGLGLLLAGAVKNPRSQTKKVGILR